SPSAAASASKARRSGSSRRPCRTGPTGKRSRPSAGQALRSKAASFESPGRLLPCLDATRKLSYLVLASVFLRVGMRRLLFLNGIKAFEAAARSGSFAAAGHELNVSAAAISRMVHLLEDRLGVALFERKANRLVTTAAGRAYQSGLTPIFDALASLT